MAGDVPWGFEQTFTGALTVMIDAKRKRIALIEAEPRVSITFEMAETLGFDPERIMLLDVLRIEHLDGVTIYVVRGIDLEARRLLLAWPD